MSNASPTVFIAYARTDTPRVEPIAATLRQRGYTVIFDPSNAHGGGNYVQASQEALRGADALIVCWSQAAAASPWIASETRAFQSQMARGGGRKLIPVWLDATPLPPELASYNAVDGWTSTPATIADMLTPALGATAPAPMPAATPASAPAAVQPAASPAAPVEATASASGEADQGVAVPEPSVFITFARADQPQAEAIATRLRERGYHVAFDASGAHGLANYVQESQQALRDAIAMVVCWSRAAAQSPWVESEVRAFQAKGVRGGATRIVSVRLDDAPLPPALARSADVDGSQMSPDALGAEVTRAVSGAGEVDNVGQIGDPQQEAVTLSKLGNAALRRGDLDAAHSAYQSVLEIMQRVGNLHGVGLALGMLGDVALQAGDLPAARAAYQNALDIMRQVGDLHEEGVTLGYLGRVARQAGDLDTARSAYQNALDIMRQVGDQRGEEAALDALEDVSRQARNLDSGDVEEGYVAPSAGASAADWEFEAERSAAAWESEAERLGRGDYGGALDGGPTTGANAPVPPAPERDAAPAPASEPPAAPASAAPPPPPVPAAPPPFVDPGIIGTVAGPPIYEPPMPSAPEPGYVAPQPTPQPITQPRGKGATTAAPAPFSGSLEQVSFTAYHPREVQPQQWQPMVVYLSLNTAAALAQVGGMAAERLGGKLSDYRPGRSERSAGMQRGAKLRIVPSAPGFQFNPDVLDVTWQEDVQQHEFRMRAETAQPGQSVNGVVQFYQGMILRGEVPISVFVGQAVARLDSPDAYQQAIARAYRHIFASYSHQDMPVVESCESAARSMGDQYLRDVTLLQSGQQWDPRLIQAINDADIFQLFWSRRAAASQFVEREWRHALMLLPTRPNFIRPVYWSRQLYATPPELNPLHFQPLSLSSLGWSKLRAAWYNMRNG